MANYEKMTVANLRALLKDRGIPSTGLTRKAQIIEKLLEEDSQRSATAEAPPAQNGSQSEQPAPDNSNAAEEAPDTEDNAAEAIQKQSVVESPATTATLEADEQVTQTSTQEAPPAVQPVPSKEPDLAAEAPAPVISQESTITQLDPEELAEDQRKRKRRSATPPVKSAEIEAKRVRLDDETTPASHQTEAQPAQDTDAVDVLQAKESLAENSSKPRQDAVEESKPTKAASHEVPVILDGTFGEAEQQSVREEKTLFEHRNASAEKTTQMAEANISPPAKKRQTEARDHRFQGLIKRDSTVQADAVLTEEEKNLPTVSPAIHPATAAIYIKNFQRPLREDQLRERLTKLAGTQDELKLCYLDPVRTHALALFCSVSAASRVRSTMHERIWPAERDRKPLWVDFVPEERVQEWIDMERDGGVGPRAGGKRWEVVYETTQADEVEARLQEVGASGPTQRRSTVPDLDVRGSARSPSPASQRRGPERQAPAQPAGAQKTFQTLDSLFKSTTTTKPKLYYLPVAVDLAERRLREISGLTKRDWDERDRRPDDELRRYTFEDDDVLVDGGGHFMSKKQMAKEGIVSTGTSNPTGRPGPPRRGRGRGPPPGDRYRGSGYADADDPYASDRRGGQSYRLR